MAVVLLVVIRFLGKSHRSGSFHPIFLLKLNLMLFGSSPVGDIERYIRRKDGVKGAQFSIGPDLDPFTHDYD